MQDKEIFLCKHMLLFNFILGLIFIFLCSRLISCIVHFYSQKQRKIKIKPRIKQNHNTCMLKYELANQFAIRKFFSCAYFDLSNKLTLIKFEKTQIPFCREVSLPSSSSSLKVPNINFNKWIPCSNVLLAQSQTGDDKKVHKSHKRVCNGFSFMYKALVSSVCLYSKGSLVTTNHSARTIYVV